MTVDDVFASSRTIIVAGKGGVGKTTVSAALACAAAQRGLRVLFIELDGKPIPAELTSGEGHISTMSLTAGDADRKSTRLNSSHIPLSRMPSSA